MVTSCKHESSSSSRACALFVAAALFASPCIAADSVIAEKSTAEQLVDVMEKLAGGHHAGFRSNHAKGIVATGEFEPAKAAMTLSKAPHLQSTSVPVIVRFSNATGVPTLADGAPTASPHGMSIRFQLPGDNFTDIVALSVNRFPVATPEEFLSFLQAVAASGSARKPTPVERFLETHPATLAFVQMPKPAPVSFATLPFFGINAFQFTNADGVSRYGRYRIVPLAGEHYLTAEQAKSAAPNYLMEELPARLAAGPVKFRISAQIAAAGDPIADATVQWPAGREEIELGTVSIAAVAPDSRAAERALAFSPTNLPDGIAPSEDPILLMRPVAYAFSVARRSN